MRFSVASLVAAVALASQASAEIFITEPVASTQCAAGTPCNVRWNDDGAAPVLATIGRCRISLYTGGAQQQTFLQEISADLDVSTNSFVTYTPNASVGENGNMYFIRFESLALKQTANPAFPYQSFSAKFTLNGMTGKFSPEVGAQISGGGGVVSTPVATIPATSTAVVTVTTSKAAAATGSGSTAPRVTATTSVRSNTTNGAVSTAMPGVIGSLAGVTVATAMAGVMLGLVALGL